MRKFLIFSPPYKENSGGVICLHRLCHLINEVGGEAYIYPSFENAEINKHGILDPLLRLVRSFARSVIPFKTNKYFLTPIYKGDVKSFEADEWIIVYYEQVFGNPLRARNVVRWLLHTPGYHTGKLYYGPNEIYYRFNDSIREFVYPWSEVAKDCLKVIHYPLEYYNLDDVSEKREGVAYCVRKGRGKVFVHDVDGSVLIDNMSHAEVAKVFKKVEVFVSYDTYTAYSIFAILCGCKSVVIPDDGVSIDEWYPNVEDRYGISYGFEDETDSKNYIDRVLSRVLSEIDKSKQDTVNFIDSSNKFFEKNRYNYFRNTAK